MELDILNPHAMKILIAANKEDSVNSLAKRTGLSYGWAYHWMQELVKRGVFARRGRKICLQEKNKFYRSALSFIKGNFAGKATFYYYALQLFGVKYCFTKTDAVYVWTKGGYNIARYRDYYPIFIKLRKGDYKSFAWHCSKLGLKIDSQDGIFYKAETMEDFPVASCAGIPVDSLEDTVAFMKMHLYNFQPALEMVHELYKIGEGRYREAITNV